MKDSVREGFFATAMWWRIGYGVLRIILGLAVLKVVGTPVTDIVTSLMGHELIEDPNDLLYTLVHDFLVNHSPYITYFMSFYLLFWGAIDIGLSYNLLKHRLWAFPISFLLIGLFVMYEAVRFSHTHSLVLLWIIIVDIGILWIMWREYQKLKPASSS